MAAFSRLLCAAALAAGAAAGEEGERATAEPSPHEEEARPAALGASVQLSASARGGRSCSQERPSVIPQARMSPSWG